MSKLTERASYLKGLADGMRLSAEKDPDRLLLEMLDLLEDTAKSIDCLTAAHNDLSDLVDAIDEDLADMEEELYDDDEDVIFDPDFNEDEDDEDDDEDGEEIIPVSENEIIMYECPHCGEELKFRAAEIDFDEDTICPACGQSVFPELAVDDSDDEE